jgi:thiol-disulfide isomerase/thioredoxin
MIAIALAGCSGQDPAAGTNPDRGETFGPTTASSDRLATLRSTADIAPCPSSDGPHVAGSDLPVVRLACLGGGPDVDFAGLVGTPMVVNFWASWCAECVDEVPYLQDVADAAAGRVLVLGVNYLDAEEGALLAAPEFGLRYPSLFDPDGVLGETFQIPGLPVTVFLDAEGEVVGQKSGAFGSVEELQHMIVDELGIAL